IPGLPGESRARPDFQENVRQLDDTMRVWVAKPHAPQSQEPPQSAPRMGQEVRRGENFEAIAASRGRAPYQRRLSPAVVPPRVVEWHSANRKRDCGALAP